MANDFEYEGDGPDGKPKWLLFPCQMRGADPEDRCRIALRPHQKNGSGASWEADGKAAPTVAPSILCGDKARPTCHFHIVGGKFNLCGDHPK